MLPVFVWIIGLVTLPYVLGQKAQEVQVQIVIFQNGEIRLLSTLNDPNAQRGVTATDVEGLFKLDKIGFVREGVRPYIAVPPKFLSHFAPGTFFRFVDSRCATANNFEDAFVKIVTTIDNNKIYFESLEFTSPTTSDFRNIILSLGSAKPWAFCLDSDSLNNYESSIKLAVNALISDRSDVSSRSPYYDQLTGEIRYKEGELITRKTLSLLSILYVRSKFKPEYLPKLKLQNVKEGPSSAEGTINGFSVLFTMEYEMDGKIELERETFDKTNSPNETLESISKDLQKQWVLDKGRDATQHVIKYMLIFTFE